MSRIGILLIVAFLPVLFATAAAADVAVPVTTVPAPDSVAAGASSLDLVPRGTVTALPAVITTPGTYTLDRDYANLAGTVAIDVQCSNVVIDGGGHTLDGLDFTDSVGIRVHGSAALSGVTVRNLRVSDWGKGVFFWNARGRIEGVTASSNTGPGILLYLGADGTVITGCTAESNGAGGLSVSYAPGAEVSSCTVQNNIDDGIYLYESSGARVTGTTASGNSLSGIALLGSSANRLTGALVSGCRAGSNVKAGIYMARAQGNTVVNNRFENAKNVLLEGAEVGANTWNTPKTAGANIAGGAYLGGNWWSGFSESAPDANADGLADQVYVISAGNTDSLPLVSASTGFAIWPGMVITQPGTYSLAGDISLPPTADRTIVIEIQCSNVVIEGNGHQISTNGLASWAGIYVSSSAGPVTGVVIRNLTVSSCYYGIYLRNADACRIERCRVTETPSGGMGLILAQGSDGTTITGTRVSASSFAGPATIGLIIASSSQNTVTDNEFRNPVNAALTGTIGTNTWSVARAAGPNIVGGAYLGGNYWGEPGGTGWSQVVLDADHDGIGDSPYVLAAGNADTAPLVRARPVASFTAAPMNGTPPLTVQFTDTSTGSPTSWAWSFGDGGSSSLQNPSHTYTTVGTYTVALQASNAEGPSETVIRTGLVTVRPPFSVASITPNAGPQGSTISGASLDGAGFAAGATVRLARAGSGESVPGMNVVVVSPARITCQFGIPSGTPTGAWDVVVTNPGGLSTALPGGFTVSAYSPPGTSLPYSGQKIVITRPGAYVLADDITNCSLTTCIEIQASNVELDGNGHLVDGAGLRGTAGIVVHGPATAVSNVTIRNVRVQDWWYGVSLNHASSCRVEGSTLASNAFAGVIAYDGATGNRVTGSTVTGNNYGLVFSDGATAGWVADSRISQNACGLYVYLSDGITVTRNTIGNNTNSGIQLQSSGGGTIYNNRFDNDLNVAFYGEPFMANAWSVPPRPAWSPPNIVGGPKVGGNYWSQPDGSGFSQTNADANGDGFVDIELQIAERNFDNCPLAPYAGPVPTGTPTPTSTPRVISVPGGSGVPTDTDGDGRCDDLNGNSRIDFADVTLYFTQLGWVAANEPATVFDFNGNGRIDFADVAWLFTHL